MLIFPGDQGCGFASVRKSRGTRIRPTGTIQSVNIFFISEKTIQGHTQVIESVELLSMTDAKDDRGYYAMKGKFHFGMECQTKDARADTC